MLSNIMFSRRAIMRILLYKARKKTLFSLLEPIIVEPLELEYVKTALVDHDVTLLDDMFHNESLKNHMKKHVYDAVVLNGYVTAEDTMLRLSTFIKAVYPQTKVMVSGVHVQLNSEVFQVPSIDAVIKTQSLEAFKLFIELKELQGQKIDGIDYQIDNKWIIGDDLKLEQMEDTLPERTIFNTYKKKLWYMDKQGVAMVKRSVSCPYECSFCYCKMLNQGLYLKRSFDDMFKEMEPLDTNVFWIIDDTLLVNEKDAKAFIEASHKYGFSGQIIAYLRSDFIHGHEGLLADLKEAGLKEVIIGFESIYDKTLKDYNKGITQIDNIQTVSLLRTYGIKLTPLFMVGLDYTLKDFKALRQFIKTQKLDLFTLSIWTPMKGTPDYTKYASQLDTIPSSHFDFLHAVLPPEQMSKMRFYWECIKIYLLLLPKKRVQKVVLRRLRNIL